MQVDVIHSDVDTGVFLVYLEPGAITHRVTCSRATSLSTWTGRDPYPFKQYHCTCGGTKSGPGPMGCEHIATIFRTMAAQTLRLLEGAYAHA
jgi:hypothetical protein